MDLTTYAIDWGHGDKLTVFDGENILVDKTTLLSFVRNRAPCRIIIESTFESYHRATKNLVINEASRLGVELLTVNPRMTARRRMSKGTEKTDENDARQIFEFWKEGKVHLSKPHVTAEVEDTRMKRIEKLRRRNWPKQDSAEFSRCLPKAPADILKVLGDGKKLSLPFCLPLVAHALDVIDAGGKREDFDRKVGMYGAGYPSFTRSHCYYHRLRALRARAHGVKSLKGVDDPIVRKDLMKKLRRATRWVYHQTRSWASGTTNP